MAKRGPPYYAFTPSKKSTPQVQKQHGDSCDLCGVQLEVKMVTNEGKNHGKYFFNCRNKCENEKGSTWIGWAPSMPQVRENEVVRREEKENHAPVSALLDTHNQNLIVKLDQYGRMIVEFTRTMEKILEHIHSFKQTLLEKCPQSPPPEVSL